MTNARTQQADTSTTPLLSISWRGVLFDETGTDGVLRIHQETAASVIGIDKIYDIIDMATTLCYA